MKANEEIGYHAAIIHHPNDWKWADWLHKSLETYVVPREFADQKINNRAIPKRLHPIFLARDDMPLRVETGSTPSEQREWALRHSCALIVIGSPEAAKSKELATGVRAFREADSNRPIVGVIVRHDDDSPASDEPAKACLPPSVWECPAGAEPFVFDITSDGLSKPTVRLKTLAVVLGLGYDDLRQRDRQRAQQRLKMILAGVLVLFTVFMSPAVTLYLEKRIAMDIGSKAQFEADRHKRAFITLQRQVDKSATALSEANMEIERLQKELQSGAPDANPTPQ